MKLTSIILIGLVAAEISLAQAPVAFHSATKQSQEKLSARSDDPSIKRSRSVTVDLSLFDRRAAKAVLGQKRRSGISQARVTMNLFEDASLAVSLEDAQPTGDRKGLVWTGSVEGHPLGHAVLVVSGSRVTGNVSSGNGIIYQIRPQADGTHSIREVDTRSFPKEAEPRLPSLHSAPQDEAPEKSNDDGTTIDVMVVYTPATRMGAGGEDGIRELIQLGIAETNQGYANSGLPQRVRLAATGEVNYQESGDLALDLDVITSTNDGVLDEVHQVRDVAGADLVSLWVEHGDACGMGWLLQSPERPVPQLGFNVVRRSCATGYFSFGHEMGHNMGAMHAEDDGGGEGAFPFSRGFKHTAGEPFFRCIMSYDCPGSGCERVNLWSSPEVRFHGIPVGTTSTDNRMTLLRTASVIAGYRKSTQGNVPPPPTNNKGYPESSHPYEDYTDRTWAYTLEGNPSAIYVAFNSNTYVEYEYDWIVITDGDGNEVEGSPFTGDALAGKTLKVPGGTVRIRLVTDESVTDYGFAVTTVSAAEEGGVDLTAVSLTAPRSGVIGGKLDGVVSIVRNAGTSPAGAFRVGYYFVSEDSQVTFSGWACQVKGLAPGATYTCGGGIGVPSSMMPGTYALVVVADDLEQTGDPNFDNNAKVSESGLMQLTH